MAYRGDAVRYLKYVNNIQAGYIPEKVLGLKESMIAQQQTWMGRLTRMEVSVKAILSEAGISTILNPFYLTFGRKVLKLVWSFSGGQLLNEVDVMLNNWALRGLDQDILEKIRNTVFTLAAPAP